MRTLLILYVCICGTLQLQQKMTEREREEEAVRKQLHALQELFGQRQREEEEEERKKQLQQQQQHNASKLQVVLSFTLFLSPSLSLTIYLSLSHAHMQHAITRTHIVSTISSRYYPNSHQSIIQTQNTCMLGWSLVSSIFGEEEVLY